MRKAVAVILSAACVSLCACTAVTTGTQEEPAPSSEPPSATTPESPEHTITPAYIIPAAGDGDMQYNLYRDCKPAEDVFAIEEIPLPQTVADKPILPVTFLDEDSVLVYTYKANTNTSDENLETIGCYNIKTGEYETWISASNEFGYTIQAIHERYLVYRENAIWYTSNFLESEVPPSARLCVYDRKSKETYTVYEYPEEYIGSSISYQDGVALAENILYFDTVHNSDGELKTAVYCADLSTLDVTLYKEDAQCPVFDGKELWVIAKEGDACVLVNTESSEKIPVPNDVAEIAIGDSIFFKLNRGTLENDEFATTELVEAQSNQPIMITQLSIDDLRLEEGVLVWTSYVDASVFLFDTQSDCFLCFESLPQGFHSLRFYQGHGLLQVGTDGAIHYYRLSKK